MRKQAAEHMASLKIGLRSMRQPVETLSGGQRQGVAVARAVSWGKRVVIMDEPTLATPVRSTNLNISRSDGKLGASASRSCRGCCEAQSSQGTEATRTSE
jgi:ABC-type oligopeptide transport system ATPase subunit